MFNTVSSALGRASRNHLVQRSFSTHAIRMAGLDFTTFSNTIGGKTISTPQTRYSINPATKEPLPPVPLSSKEDLDRAVSAARDAFPGWSSMPWDERKKAILAFGQAITENLDGLARMLTQEQGKPLPFAQREIGGVERTMQAMTSIRLEDEVLKSDTQRKIIKRYLPLGVAGAIVPWNYPIILMMNKCTEAIWTGNTVVIKPSPFTPYTSLKIGELAQRHLPPGVVNVVSGDDNLGPWMTLHPGIDKISFTGSTATGKKVMESCSKTLKRVTLELGGKDPAIILPDVNIPLVASQISIYSFLNSGQICMATKRIYVHESIAEEFVKAVVEFTKNLKVGNGMEEGTFFGPIQNEMQFNKVNGFIKDLAKDGGKIVLDGGLGGGEGFFVRPTIIFNPADGSRIMTEEPFGPILPIATYSTDEEAIRRANDSEMGLGASVWGQDIQKAEKIARQLQAGNVWINEHVLADPSAPFGGFKQSGIGKEYGREGLAGYCNIQSLYVKREVKSLL